MPRRPSAFTGTELKRLAKLANERGCAVEMTKGDAKVRVEPSAEPNKQYSPPKKEVRL